MKEDLYLLNSKVIATNISDNPSEVEIHQAARDLGVYGHVTSYVLSTVGKSHVVVFSLDKSISEIRKKAEFNTNIEQGKKFINPESGEITEVKSVKESPEGRVVEISDSTNPSASAYVDEESFKNMYQPVQTSGV